MLIIFHSFSRTNSFDSGAGVIIDELIHSNQMTTINVENCRVVGCSWLVAALLLGKKEAKAMVLFFLFRFFERKKQKIQVFISRKGKDLVSKH